MNGSHTKYHCGKPWRPPHSSCSLVTVLSRRILNNAQGDLTEWAYFTGFHSLVWSFVHSKGLSNEQIIASALHKNWSWVVTFFLTRFYTRVLPIILQARKHKMGWINNKNHCTSLNSKENAPIYQVDIHIKCMFQLVFPPCFQRAGCTQKALHESSVSPFVWTSCTENGCLITSGGRWLENDSM